MIFVVVDAFIERPLRHVQACAPERGPPCSGRKSGGILHRPDQSCGQEGTQNKNIINIFKITAIDLMKLSPWKFQLLKMKLVFDRKEDCLTRT